MQVPRRMLLFLANECIEREKEKRVTSCSIFFERTKTRIPVGEGRKDGDVDPSFPIKGAAQKGG